MILVDEVTVPSLPIPDFNWVLFIKDTYPVSAISMVLCGFGYALMAIGCNKHLKDLDEITQAKELIIEKYKNHKA
jgi:hypothetical protein